METSIVLFDGICNLCSGTVQFILPRDPKKSFRFASLQSPEAEVLLSQYQIQTDPMNSILLIEGGQWFQKSSAVLKIARHLSGLWPILALFLLIPRPLRDFCYDWIAKHRYRWFGKRATCLYSIDSYQDRFL